MAWLEWHLALCLISGERLAVIVDRGGEWRPGVLFLVLNPMISSSSSSPSYLSPSLLSLTLCLSLPSQRVCLALFITWPRLPDKAGGVVQDTSAHAHAFVRAFKHTLTHLRSPVSSILELATSQIVLFLASS